MKNILSCIEAVYAKAKDFTVKFEFVNRNTLSHGMLDREVEQKDCKKIFLLLYNILQLLDYYKIQVI